MPDRMSPEDRSYTMSQITSTGTEPEQNLGALLREILPDGEPLVEHADDLPGTPDFYLPEREIAFFADGCFFHKCPDHFQMPQSNEEYWRPKIDRNCERDREVDKNLRSQNISPVRIWEHDLKEDLTSAISTIEEALQVG